MGFGDRYLRLRIVSAEPENLLTQLLYSNVELHDITPIDYLTVEVKVKKQYDCIVRKIVEKNGGTCRITGVDGFLWNVQRLLRRPALIVGISMFILASCLINGRILFVTVQGNKNIHEQLILSVARDCGITFGTKAAKVRSEDIKNQLMQKMPQLQWLGITTSGSVATIHVKERSMQNDAGTSKNAMSNIIASRDGVISQMTVYKGNPLFHVGQTVQAGDVLVSGYTDYGLAQKWEQPEAEIFAHTFREMKFYTPVPSVVRGEQKGVHTCYMVRIGKKVINFCNHSGISDATCVKMYMEDYLTLPGGFQLPVSIIKITSVNFYSIEVECAPEKFKTWLPQFAGSYVSSQMVAGKILSEELFWDINEQVCILNGNFACHEMIGQVINEEILKQNAEDN